MENDFTNSLALSKAPAWTHPWSLPHPLYVMSGMIARIIRGSIAMAEAIGEDHSCSIDFSDSGQPSLVWLSVVFRFEGIPAEETEALVRAASAFNHDPARGESLFRGIVFDMTRPGCLFCMVSLETFQSFLYGHGDVTRYALRSVQGVDNWHKVAADEGARIDAGSMVRVLRKEVDNRIALYRAAIVRADVACLTIADMFGLEHSLSDDIASTQEAYEFFLSKHEDYVPDLNIVVPETMSLTLKGQALL